MGYLISNVVPFLHSNPFLMVTELEASKVVEPLSIITGPSSFFKKLVKTILNSCAVLLVQRYSTILMWSIVSGR